MEKGEWKGRESEGIQTTFQDLQSDTGFMDMVLSLLKETTVGEVKEVIIYAEALAEYLRFSGYLFPPPPPPRIIHMSCPYSVLVV